MTDANTDRPALAKPAEGEVHERNLSASNAELIGQALSHPPLTPTPPSVDWERVGPKLVEALEAIKAGGSWQGDTASDALAAEKPEDRT